MVYYEGYIYNKQQNRAPPNYWIRLGSLKTQKKKKKKIMKLHWTAGLAPESPETPIWFEKTLLRPASQPKASP